MPALDATAGLGGKSTAAGRAVSSSQASCKLSCLELKISEKGPVSQGSLREALRALTGPKPKPSFQKGSSCLRVIGWRGWDENCAG